MADLLRRRAEFLSAKRHEHMSHPVTARRGSLSTTLNATVGPVRVEADVEVDVQLIANMKDFIVRKIDYTFNGVQALPVKGDRLEDDDGTIYTVFPIVDETVYRETEDGNDLRIHAKKTG